MWHGISNMETLGFLMIERYLQALQLQYQWGLESIHTQIQPINVQLVFAYAFICSCLNMFYWCCYLQSVASLQSANTATTTSNGGNSHAILQGTSTFLRNSRELSRCSLGGCGGISFRYLQNCISFSIIYHLFTASHSWESTRRRKRPILHYDNSTFSTHRSSLQ